MPKLLALIVCEKVIIDRNDMPSFINVFQKMKIQLPGAPLPEKAVSPIRWSVFSLWQYEDAEMGKAFTQLLEVIMPNSETFASIEGEIKAPAAGEIQSQVSVAFLGLPIWAEGFIQVRVSLKDSDEPTHTYKFAVKYLPKESNAEAGNA